MKSKISSKTRVFKEDNIDTDIIIPACFLNTFDTAELSLHAMEGLESDFHKNAEKILVAGKNFGCGSSREHAVWALSGCGVEVVIAESFARIFFKNAINFGIFPVILKDAPKLLEDREEIEIDFKNHQVKCEKGTFEFEKLPGFISKITEAGGLIPLLAKG